MHKVINIQYDLNMALFSKHIIDVQSNTFQNYRKTQRDVISIGKLKLLPLTSFHYF